MYRAIFILALFNISFSWGQPEQHTWDSLHEAYLSSIRSSKSYVKYQDLIDKEENSKQYWAKRMGYAWVLGKMDDITQNLPRFLYHPDFDMDSNPKERFYDMIQFGRVPQTEWVRMSGMLRVLFEAFDDALIKEMTLEALVAMELYTGQYQSAVVHAEQFLEQYPKSDGRVAIQGKYVAALNGLKEYDKAGDLSQKYYTETGNPDFLRGYCTVIYNKGDMVEFLMLEDSIRKHRFYFQYFDLMELHMERGDDDKLKYYVDWFRDSVTIQGYDTEYEISTGNISYSFSFFQIAPLADYFRQTDSEYACELYSNMLKSIEELEEPSWRSESYAERFLVTVGTESEEEAMHSWKQETLRRKELKETCEAVLRTCED